MNDQTPPFELPEYFKKLAELEIEKIAKEHRGNSRSN